jgi:hypothetical protein
MMAPAAAPIAASRFVCLTVTSPPEVVVTVPEEVPAVEPELPDPLLAVEDVVRRVVVRGAVLVVRRVVEDALRLLVGAVFVAAPASSAEMLSSRVCCWAARVRSFCKAALSAALSSPPHAAAPAMAAIARVRIM